MTTATHLTAEQQHAIATHAIETATAPGAAPADAIQDHDLVEALLAHGEPIHLAPRELDLLRGIADGLTWAQVAARLAISPNSTSEMAHRMYVKLHVHSREQAVRTAVHLGIIPCPMCRRSQ